jgi:hypothetical protein
MKIFTYIIPILNILILSFFWIVIQLDVKFSFGAEQTENIFMKGQELGMKTDWFILVLIILNIMLFFILFFTKKIN